MCGKRFFITGSLGTCRGFVDRRKIFGLLDSPGKPMTAVDLDEEQAVLPLVLAEDMVPAMFILLGARMCERSR
jgi:hypothetical protein